MPVRTKPKAPFEKTVILHVRQQAQLLLEPLETGRVKVGVMDWGAALVNPGQKIR